MQNIVFIITIITITYRLYKNSYLIFKISTGRITIQLNSKIVVPSKTILGLDTHKNKKFISIRKSCQNSSTDPTIKSLRFLVHNFTLNTTCEL